MRLDRTEDQASLLSTVSAILSGADRGLASGGEKASFDGELDAKLAENGVFEAASYPELGLPAAAMVVQEVCRRPGIVEVGASALMRPILCPEAPRPLAVVHGEAQRAVRFLPVARAVLFLSEGRARWAAIGPDDVEAAESYFAYPVGRLRDPERCLARARPCLDPDRAEQLGLVATAAEIAGVLQGGLESVIEHVRDRRQFGRPLGSFQALQHRLAACSQRIASARWLTLRAADGGIADALLAAGYAQEAVEPVAYDLHQFMGAMGLTLEHPLYRWTYRAKLLRSDLGGASRQFRALADAAFP